MKNIYIKEVYALLPLDPIAPGGEVVPTGIAVYSLPEFTIMQNGAQSITLPLGANGVFDLNAYETPNGGVRPIYQQDYRVSAGVLTIRADASLVAGDKLGGSYYTGSSSGSGGGVSTPGTSGIAVFTLPEFTVTQSGAQSIPLPDNATGVLDLTALESTQGGVRPFYQLDYAVSAGILTINAVANLVVGDKISGSYITGSGSASPTGFTAADLTNLLNAANWNTANFGEYTGAALTTTVVATHTQYASATQRGIRFETNGKGKVNRYFSV